MADTFLTLAELAKVNDANSVDPGISDILDEAPVLAMIAGEETDGNTYTYVKQTGAPSVGFRAVNAGRENKASTDTVVVDTLKFLDCSLAIDVAIADQFKDGPAAYLQREAARHLRAGFSKLEIQLIYGAGTGGDATGFVGLEDDPQLNALVDEMVIDGGGAGVNLQTSVLAIRTNDSARDVQMVLGNNGQIKIGDTVTQFIDDTDGGSGRFMAYCTPIHAWAGMAIGGARSVARLANVDTVATLNDDKISDLLATFPANKGPQILAMSRVSLKQLQQSRTSTNGTGAPAPFPTESFGVPIAVTDSINATEAVVA